MYFSDLWKNSLQPEGQCARAGQPLSRITSAEQDWGEQLCLIPSTARMQLVASTALHASALYGSVAPATSLGWVTAPGTDLPTGKSEPVCAGASCPAGQGCRAPALGRVSSAPLIRCTPDLETPLAGAFTTQPAACNENGGVFLNL